MKNLQTSMAIVILWAAPACSNGDDSEHDKNLPSCEEDSRDEEYVAGISKKGPKGYTITLVDSNPAPPSRGDNVWKVTVKDSQGSIINALQLELAPFMPDHGHGTPVVPTIKEETTTGIYTINPVNLFMPGYWEITIKAIDPGATDSDNDVELDSVKFKFCVEG